MKRLTTSIALLVGHRIERLFTVTIVDGTMGSNESITLKWAFRSLKVVTIKLKKQASIWWEQFKMWRFREGKSRIESWEDDEKA